MSDLQGIPVRVFRSTDPATGEDCIVVVNLDALAKHTARALSQPIIPPPPPDPPMWSRFAMPMTFHDSARNHFIAASKSFDDMTNDAADLLGMTREDFDATSAALGHESPMHHAARIWTEDRPGLEDKDQ